jgi:hypothetical protein
MGMEKVKLCRYVDRMIGTFPEIQQQFRTLETEMLFLADRVKERCGAETHFEIADEPSLGGIYIKAMYEHEVGHITTYSGWETVTPWHVSNVFQGLPDAAD